MPRTHHRWGRNKATLGMQEESQRTLQSNLLGILPMHKQKYEIIQTVMKPKMEEWILWGGKST